MGYVHVTDIKQFIPPTVFGKTAGTWALTFNTGLVYDARTAADAEFSILIPIPLPGSEVGLQGAMIKAVDIWYRVSGAAHDDFAVVKMYKVTGSDHGSACAAAEITGITLDTGHDTAAECKAVAHHKMTVTIDDPVFIAENTFYYILLTVDGAAASVHWSYGAQAHFTLRI